MNYRNSSLICICAASLFMAVLIAFFVLLAYNGCFLERDRPEIYYIASVATWVFSFSLIYISIYKKKKIYLPVFLVVSLFGGICTPYIFNKYAHVYYWHNFLSSNLVYSIQTSQPVVALTFDDGPEATRTGELLDVLKAHHAHASFFLVGKKVSENSDIVQRMLREGHSVGNHSWSHKRFRELSDDELVQELNTTNKAIEAIMESPVRFVRPPGGDLTVHQKDVILSHFNFQICMWNRSTLDYASGENLPTSVMINNVIEDLKNGCIILAHDYAMKPETLDALLTEIEKRGFKAVSIQELLNPEAK